MTLTHKFFTATHLILIAMSIYLGVDLFYNVLVGQKKVYPKIQVRHNPPESPARKEFLPYSYYKHIFERNLFKTKQSTNEAPVTLESLNPTELDLNLWGTVTGNSKRHYAVIEDLNGKRSKSKQRLYSIGDSIQGATIKNILDEKVVLQVNGENEILKMEKISSRRGRHRRYRSSRLSRPPVRMRVNLKRSLVDNAMDNVTQLMDKIRVSPHSRGIRISRINPRSIFRRMGLRPGDIITGVDGKRIDSVDSALGIYEGLSSSSKVTLELIRRGRERVIDYLIR